VLTLPDSRYAPALTQRPTVPQLKWLLCFAGLHTPASDVCDPTWKGVAMSRSSLMNSFVFVWLSLKRSLGILLFSAVVNVCKKKQRLNVSAQAQDSEVHVLKIAILGGSVFNNMAIARNMTLILASSMPATVAS
jgi:hypothetical protein